MRLIAEAKEGVPAELLGDGLDLARGDALHVHLRQGADQGLLAARVALEELRGETSLAVARHAQLELADAGDQAALVVAGAVAETTLAALPALGAQSLGHLDLEDLGHGGAHDLTHQVGIVAEQRFPVGLLGPKLLVGHGVLPFEG
jgi:hypothetical protein